MLHSEMVFVRNEENEVDSEYLLSFDGHVIFVSEYQVKCRKYINDSENNMMKKRFFKKSGIVLQVKMFLA